MVSLIFAYNIYGGITILTTFAIQVGSIYKPKVKAQEAVML